MKILGEQVEEKLANNAWSVLFQIKNKMGFKRNEDQSVTMALDFQ